MKTALQQLLSEGKTDQVIAELRRLTAADPYLHEQLVLVAGRQAALERKINTGTARPDDVEVESNKIRAALLDLVKKMPEEVGESFTKDNYQSKMEQKPNGTGDNVAGNKIGRQINMGSGSTYNEYKKDTSQEIQPPPIPQEKLQPAATGEPQKLPESPSGVVGVLLGWLPKPLRPVISILVIALGTYVGYHYFISPTENDENAEISAPVRTPEKVFVSGIIHINNGEPKPNEIRRMTLRDVDANPARIDGTGRFTFSDVKIPANKRLLVDVTFFDGKTVPTQELIVGEADNETLTVRLPDLFAERPKPATKNSPAKSWSINIVHNGVGNNNVQIQK